MGGPNGNKRPWRYRLYDRLNISVRTINYVIYGIIGLIVLALIVGMTVMR